jgi:pimeloyl-ACP methyl ester carboxylesterase
MGHAGKAGVGELELSWDSFGDPDDPALVLVMGLGADRGYWRDPFCEAIAALGRRVIRFDNRDVGESTRLNHLDVPNAAKLILARRFGRTTNVPYHLEDMADDVVGRVRSLTSIMSTTGSTRVPWPRLRGLIWLARPSPLELEARVKHFKRLRIYIEGGYYVPDDADREAQCRIDIARMGFDARGSARQFAAVAMQRDRTEDLRQLDVPTLVVHGRRDPLVRPKCGQATADAIPGARLAWFEHMGHVIAPELYEPIADAIRDNARRGE